MEVPRTKARAAAISSTAIFRAAQSTSGPCSCFSHVDGSDMEKRGGEGEGGDGRGRWERGEMKNARNYGNSN